MGVSRPDPEGEVPRDLGMRGRPLELEIMADMITID
jgi:hypothetical protein